MHEFLRRLRYYFRRRQFESDLEEEMSHHAELAGRKQFGNLTHLKEESRSAWTWAPFEQLGQDLRYTLRSMRASPMFTALAAVSLALGIGVNTAIFSVMEAILLRPLPVPDPGSLVTLNWTLPPPPETKGKAPRPQSVVKGMMAQSTASYTDPRTGVTSAVFPYPAFRLFRSTSQQGANTSLPINSPLASVFAYVQADRLHILADSQTDVVNGMYISGEYFSGLGVVPSAGRLVDPRDDLTGAPAVAVLSHAYWTRRFGQRPDIVGRTVEVNRIPVIVTGVAAAGFDGIDPAFSPDLYLPLQTYAAVQGSPFPDYPNFYWLEMMARLRPGATREQAQAALAPVFHSFADSTATNDEQRRALPALLVKSAAGGLDGLKRQFSKPLYVLMTLVGLILAIACANLANLLLARAASRRREMAVRLSMGAGRLRVIRQLLTESVVLALLGGAAGIAVAQVAIRFMPALYLEGSQDFTLRAEINGTVLAVTAAISVLTGLLFGLAPALRATRVDIMPALKEVRANPDAGRHGPWRVNTSQLLLIGQVAVSLLLLIAAGLFVRTLSNLQSLETGFNAENVLLFDVSLQAGAPPGGPAAFFPELREQVAALPGVRDVSYSAFSLVSGSRVLFDLKIPGQTAASRASFLWVGPSFFETMQIPLLQGREFTSRDKDGAPRVAIVNQRFVRDFLGGGAALGTTFTSGPDQPIEIVGVVANTRYGTLQEEFPPMAYVPVSQSPLPRMVFALRAPGDPAAHVAAIRRMIQQVDPRIALTEVRTQRDQIGRTIAREIMFAYLCSFFALLALTVSCVGLYGLAAYGVARRTSEIGIRMALGAQHGRLFWMVLRETLVLCVIGLAVGVPVALAASRWVESFLFGMRPNDPLAIVAAVGLLLAAAVVAACVPARRALRIDPIAALRHD